MFVGKIERFASKSQDQATRGLKTGEFFMTKPWVSLLNILTNHPLWIVWRGPCSNYKDDAHVFLGGGVIGSIVILVWFLPVVGRGSIEIRWAKVCQVLKQPSAECGHKQYNRSSLLTRYNRFARAIPRFLQESRDANPSSGDTFPKDLFLCMVS